MGGFCFPIHTPAKENARRDNRSRRRRQSADGPVVKGVLFAGEEMLEPRPERSSDKTKQHGAHCQDHEWHRHDRRTFVRCVMSAMFAEENIRHLARHVEGCETGANQAKDKWNFGRTPTQCRV